MSNLTISLVVPERVNRLIEKVARNRGEDKSSFIRRAIYKELAYLSFLSPEEKKALGIKNKEILEQTR